MSCESVARDVCHPGVNDTEPNVFECCLNVVLKTNLEVLAPWRSRAPRPWTSARSIRCLMGYNDFIDA